VLGKKSSQGNGTASGKAKISRPKKIPTREEKSWTLAPPAHQRTSAPANPVAKQKHGNRLNIPLSLLYAAIASINSAWAQEVEVSNESEYKAALQGSGKIRVMGQGFNVTTDPGVSSNAVEISSEWAPNFQLPVLSGSGGDGSYRAVSSSSGFKLTNIAIEDFGLGGALATGGAVEFSNVRFKNNGNSSGTQKGGALNANGASVFISNGYFVDNRSSGSDGGALSLMNGSGSISDSYFIANNAAQSGGAIFAINSSLDINGADFLGNRAQNGASGAIFHSTTAGQTHSLNIDNSLFYGNKNGTGYSSLRLVGGANATLNVQIGGNDGNVWMFDSIFSTSGGLTTNVTKSGSGYWYLGGISGFLGSSTWSINNGSLILTTVNYGDQSAGSAIELNENTSSFTLESAANLGGSGRIKAPNITLNGMIDPWREENYGLLATQISASTPKDQGELIGSRVTSATANIRLEGNVKINHSQPGKYFWVSVDGNNTDKLEITGNLTVGEDGMGLFIDPQDDTQGALNNVTLISATGGISKLSTDDWDEVIRLQVPDYLTYNITNNPITVTNNAISISGPAPELTWNTSVMENGKYIADGEFNVADGSRFTVTKQLSDRSGITTDNTEEEWDGKTLAKTGTGTLVLNNTSNNYSGGTFVQDGWLLVGGRCFRQQCQHCFFSRCHRRRRWYWRFWTAERRFDNGAGCDAAPGQ